MSASNEHRKMTDFVNSYKAANAKTVVSVRKFDSKMKTWTIEVVVRDENAVKFSKDLKKANKRIKRQKNPAEKKTVTAPNLVSKKKAVQTTRVMPTKPRSEMRLNVVRLHNDGLKFKEIGKLYGVSETSARTAYHRELHDK